MAPHSSTLTWKIPWTAKSLQSCPTLCDPIDGSPTGSPVPGVLQARTLEWVAMSFSNVLAHEINFWGNGYLKHRTTNYPLIL